LPLRGPAVTLRSTTNSRATGEIPVSLSTADVVLPAEEQPVDAHGAPVLVDGEVPAELFLPEGAGPWPGIVMGAEAYGPNHTTRTVSAALAQRGFAVLLPDYCRGAGPVDRENYEDFTEVTGAIATLDFRRAFLDTAAAVDHLRETWPRSGDASMVGASTSRSWNTRARTTPSTHPTVLCATTSPTAPDGRRLSRSSSGISPRGTRTAARDRDGIPVGDAGAVRTIA
jgi:hypothetical protein